MGITQINVSSPTNESSALVYSVVVNNTANGASSYVKLFNLAQGSVTLGTTPPDEIVFVPASTTVTHVLSTGAAPGKTFGTALSAACVTVGGTSGSTSPASSVVVTITYQ
jgi:hypothetical protein